MVRLNNTFSQLSLMAAYADWKGYNTKQFSSFVKSNFDNTVLDHLYREEYLISEEYRSVIRNGWLNYLSRLDFEKDATLKKEKEYKLKKASETYPKKIKEYVIYARMHYAFVYSDSLSQLRAYKDQFEPYCSSLQQAQYKQALFSTFTQQEEAFLRMQAGQPAPSFTLQSNTGKTYSLADFKGKVVYVDLWASWCAPCRAETPAFKRLYTKYKHDQRVAFVGIAVLDVLKKSTG